MASVSVEKVMNDAIIALNANELHIQMLMNALKEAREKKKLLRETVKEAKANFKANVKAKSSKAKSSKAKSSGPRIYKDNAMNRKLERVGKPIPSKKKVSFSTAVSVVPKKGVRTYKDNAMNQKL